VKNYLEFRGRRYMLLSAASGWVVMAFIFGFAMGVVSLALHIAGGK